MRRLVVFLALTSLLAGVFGVIAPAATAGSNVGNFEIDGNQLDSPAGEPIDWSTPPPNLTHFEDGTGSSDDSFNQGAKELEPGGWVCQTGSAPGKGDITAGDIAFRTLGGKQFIYVDFFRATTSGDVHIDYEFNQLSTPNPACPVLAQRKDGDIIITFDTDVAKVAGKTQHVILVRAFSWKFANNSTTKGTFTELPLGSLGTTFDAATNQNDTASPDRGNYGEAALNLTDTIGNVECGEFSKVHMNTRSSTSISSALQDRTEQKDAVVGECPNSNLAKAVRNFTTNGTFNTTATATPGQVLEYRLRYTNAGNLAATGVVVTDVIQAKQTLVPGSCSPACTGAGTQASPLNWNLGTQAPGATVDIFFRVTLDSSGWSTTQPNTVKNVAVVDSGSENPENSNETTTTVNASTIITSAKSVTPASGNVGDTVHYTITLTNTGNQPGTTNVTDNYDQAHLTISNINPSGTDNGDTIVWTNITVNPGTPVLLKYDATIKGTFSGGAGSGGCAPNQFPVVNSVTLSNGTGTSATLCVNGQANITVVKTVNPTSANEGDTVTYTLTLSNSGNIPGTITVTDNYDQAHLTVSNITAPGIDNGDTITWSNISVPVGANSKVLTYSALVKVGSFSGTPGGSPCSSTQFPVVNMVTLSSGGGDNETLCVNGHADITIAKSVSPTSANVGDTVTYTITLTNTGNIAGTRTVVDDYDQAHLQVSNISNGGVDNGNTITWTNLTVPVGTTTLTYKAKVIGTFSGGPGPDCQLGQFPVVNHVQITGGPGDDNTLCVNAEPDLHVVKSADKNTIISGDTVTYTLAYSNDGDAAATNVVITETVPDGTSFAGCTGSCNSANLPTVTWSIGTVPAGTGGSVTMTVTVTSLTACEICNVARISSTEVPAPGVASNRLCVGNIPTPNPDGARAGGNATPALVQSSLLNLDLTLPQGNDGAGDHTSVDSFQAGPGTDTEEKELLAVDVPPPSPGSVLHATVLRAATQSTVTRTPARADDISSSSAANVSILDGLIPGVPAVVKATAVRGVASAEATGTSAHVSSLGSAIEGLEVLGIPQAVSPGARVDLPAALFGVGSYVAIYEQIKSVTTPTGSSDGTYDATLTTNMIRVHITGMVIVGAVEVVVGHATAHADFPQTSLCGPQVHQSVSGDAFMARLITDPSIAPVVVGGIEIPTSGGIENNSVNTIVVDPLLTSKTATTHVESSFSPLNSTSQSYAEVKFLCLLDTPTGCTISARLVRAQANAVASALNRASNYVGTDFVGLKIGPQTISLPVPPNTVIAIPGLATVILNEQFCDNNGTLASACSDGTVPGHTGLTVRAIHVILLDPVAGGTPGVDLIVAEAHADARFV